MARRTLLTTVVIVGCLTATAGCGETSSGSPVAETITVTQSVADTQDVPAPITVTVTETADPAEPVEITRHITDESEVTATVDSAEETPDTAQAFPTADFEPRPGYIPKAVGDTAALVASETGTDMAVIFAFDEINPDFQCTSKYADPPENGRFLGVHFTVEITEFFDKETTYGFNTSTHAFTVLSSDGKVENDSATIAAYSCLDTKDGIGSNLDIPGTTSTGWVVLDTEFDHGSLLFSQSGMSGGWEWQF